MRQTNWLLWCCATALAVSGCTYDLSFNSRASHATVQEAKDLSALDRGPIAIEWNPATFPERVDTKGPSGNEGAASRANIPTGVAIATRLDELLDIAVGVDRSSPNVLTISVIEAKSDYEYAIGMITSRHIDAASGVFEGEFSIGNTRWRERFTAEARDRGGVDGAKGTGLLDRVWDDLALQVATSVAQRDWESTALVQAPPPAPQMPTYAEIQQPNNVPPNAPAAADVDHRLQRLIDAWPRLSESVRNRIAGIVEGAELSGDD